MVILLKFSFDVCEAFLAADVPILKLIKPILRNVREIYLVQSGGWIYLAKKLREAMLPS
jgi:hypothetical protein